MPRGKLRIVACFVKAVASSLRLSGILPRRSNSAPNKSKTSMRLQCLQKAFAIAGSSSIRLKKSEAFRVKQRVSTEAIAVSHGTPRSKLVQPMISPGFSSCRVSGAEAPGAYPNKRACPW